MSRFVSCGKLRCQYGDGFIPPDFLRPKDGIFTGNLTITNDMLDKNGRLKIKLKEVTGDFWCNITNISSLEGAPETVRGYFSCITNPKLTSLKGAPKTVGGYFWCSHTNISSLKGAPKTVVKDFRCNNNPKLTSLKGAPKTVVKNFYIQNAGRKFTEEEVRAVCDVGGKVYV